MLAEQIVSGHPAYAVQARGLDHTRSPDERAKIVQFWPPGCWVNVMSRRFREHAKVLVELPARMAISQIVQLCSGFWGHIRRRKSRQLPSDVER